MNVTKFVVIGLLSLGLGCGAAKKAGDNAMDKANEEAQKQIEEQTKKVQDAAGDQAKRGALEAAANGPHRSEANKARNKYRNPVDTLLFFGVEPDDTVVEIWPGGGWYTEVLAPYLADGKLIAASYAPKEDPEHYRTKSYHKYKKRLETEPVFKNVTLGMLEPGQKIDIGEPRSADYVLTFRNLHSFVRADVADEVFATANQILKDGGILGVVQHRAKPGVTNVKEKAETGYVPEAYVLQLAEEHGFELVDKTDINANPKDTTEWPEGVWTLPPSLRLEDTDRDKYMAIGESDRMTMKFKKVKDLSEVEPGEPEPDTTPDPEEVTE